MTTDNDHIFNGFDNDYNYNYDDDYYGVDSNSDSGEGILILLISSAFLVTFGCCYYKASQSSSSQNNNRNDSHDRDLRQIRQRLSERGNSPRVRVGVASSGDTSDVIAVAVDRKELIKKNLFTRVIQREESVRELCEVLSISRGGYEVDEELGVCGSADRTTTSSSSEPAQPSPSAPSLESDNANDATEVQTEQTTEPTSMPVHRLLANLSVVKERMAYSQTFHH